ncbi:MAG TPA: rhomboid family intramembrane serine protease, partial [Candidatus Limnocylindria bacterium]
MFPIGDENEPGHGLAWVTASLIGINVAVFVLLQGLGAENAFTTGFSAVPLEITTGRDLVNPETITLAGQTFLVPQAPGPFPIQLTLLTSMFMHAGWLHLAGNMLFLWVFGDNVEHRAGAILFVAVYLGTGLVGSLAQIWSDPTSPIPTLGASGAISGILGAYLVLFPRNRVTVFIFRFVTQVPALAAIGLWIVFQLINGLGAAVISSETVGGVAYLAHIGGFAAGLFAGFLLRG